MTTRQSPAFESPNRISETLDADAAAWPFRSDSAVLEGVVLQKQALSIMLVNLCGFDWNEVERLLPVASKGASDQNMLAVLVVDMIDLAPLQNAGFAYDTLPNVLYNSAILPDLNWRAYFARRKMLLIEKWQPSAIVHLGSEQDW